MRRQPVFNAREVSEEGQRQPGSQLKKSGILFLSGLKTPSLAPEATLKAKMAVLEKWRGHQKNLLGAAGHYDKTLRDFEEGSEGHIILSGSARNTLEETRRLMEEEGCREDIAHSRELEKLILKVVEEIGKLGLGYLMDGEGYNEKAAQDLEDVSRKATEAGASKKEGGKPDTAGKDPEIEIRKLIAVIDDYIRENPDAAEHDRPGEMAHYLLEVQRLNGIFDALRAEYPPEAIRDLMVELADGIITHNKDLGRHVLNVLQKTDNPQKPRMLDTMGESPPNRVEFLINASRCFVRMLGVMKWQRELLLDEEQEVGASGSELASA